MILSIGYSDRVYNNIHKQVKNNNEKDENCRTNMAMDNRELKGVPKSYVIFKGENDKKLSLAAGTKEILNSAKETAIQLGHSEITPAHIIDAFIQQLYKNYNQFSDEILDSGVIENLSPLSDLMLQQTGKDFLQDKSSRALMLELVKNLENDNDNFLKSLPVQDEVTDPQLTETFANSLAINAEKFHNTITPFTLLATAFNQLGEYNAHYGTEFLLSTQSSQLYKTLQNIKKDYMKLYDNRALDVWNKLALGANLNIIYKDSKEADRITASMYKTLNSPNKYGNFNNKNTHIFVFDNNINTEQLYNETEQIKENNVNTQNVLIINLDNLLANSIKDDNDTNYINGLAQVLQNADKNNKIILFQSDDTYYNLVSNPQLKTIFTNFISHSIPPVQTYEARPLLNTKMTADIDKPFTSDAKDRIIYHSANMQGIFPDKAVDLMNRVATYYGNTKQEITVKEVDEFAQNGHELFSNTNDDLNIIYDTGKTLSSMYGKETTKKDIEAIIRQIKTGRIGTRGILIYSKDAEAGSGRKYTAETIAGEAKVPFIAINSSDFAESEKDELGHVISSPKIAMKKVFSKAKKAAGQNQYKTAIIFVNDFEEFAFSGPYLAGYKQAMSQMSDEMQQAEKEDVNIVVIGSTSEYYASEIPCFVKGFNQSIIIDTPATNREARKEILMNKIKTDIPISAKSNSDREKFIDKLVTLTEWMSYVEIKSLIDKSKQIMYERNKEKATIGDFIEAYLQMMAGRTSHPQMQDFNKEATTSHECGHATNLEVMNDLLKRRGKPWHRGHDVNFITLDPRGSFLGAVFESKADNVDYPFEAMFTALVCSFGGYSAEKLFFGMDGSGGISQDLAQATSAAKRGIEYFGFGHNTGKISNAVNLRSSTYAENVFKDINVLIENAKCASDLITECYRKFNESFTQKYSKLIGTDDCMVEGTEFVKALNNWKKHLSKKSKEEILIMEDIIMDIIEQSKKGIKYGHIKK